MILAAVLRNYKCYKGIHLIPFSCDQKSTLNIIIGNNGVGKSAILEGLDTLFNNASWIINNDIRKRDETSVGAFFLINKEIVNSILDSREREIVSKISDFFWDIDPGANTTLKSYEGLKDYRSRVLEQKDSMYFLLIGKNQSERELGFLSFNTAFRSSLDLSPKPSSETISRILDRILQLNSYIYIPVETPVSSFVRLQNQSMQTLMDKSIKEDISKRLNEGLIPTGESGTRKKKSVLDFINEILDNYIEGVQTDIRTVNQGYSYDPIVRRGKKLTANHVTDTIIDAYYSKRAFKKDGKHIENLSSGEKRVILIDLITVFLQKNNPDRELIIGIDEPENSLHVSHCYEQFSKISSIALDYNHQMFVTTHWYGALPCLDEGGLIHISDECKVNYYELQTYYEDRKSFPNDVYLKGFFDLSSSLLYAFRNTNKTMFLVEGGADRRYLDYYLCNPMIHYVPLGGCSNVKKIFDFLRSPMDIEENGDATKNNRIICLVDTDSLCTRVMNDADMHSKKLILRRWHQEPGRGVELKRNNDPTVVPTEIEDILIPNQFYNAVREVINAVADPTVSSVFSCYSFNSTAVSSRIKGDDSILLPSVSGRNIVDDKQVICSFIDKYKDEIARKYTSYPKTGPIPSWVQLLSDMAFSRP